MARVEHDIERLPKWAQREIRRLTNDVEHLRTRLEAGPEDSDTFADAFSESKRPLGRGTQIEFRFGDRWDQRFMVRLEGRRLIVAGGERIAVRPQASNVVEIESVAR